MPEVSLANLSLILGVLAVAKGIWGYTSSAKAIEFTRAFPRNDNAGYVTILAAMVWFLLILKSESMSDFERYRMHFNGFILITGIGACIYLKDYLAVRGTAVLMILLAKFIAFKQSSPVLYESRALLPVVFAAASDNTTSALLLK